MAIGDVMSNLTELMSVLPPQVIENLGSFILILKAVGIAAIVYVVYVVTMGVLTYLRIKRMKHIEEKVDSIDKKLDRLMRKKKKY